jgi:lysophospholipase L1-like esterase
LPRQAGCAGVADSASLCILILGDSLAVGAPLIGDDRWWRRLQATLGTALPNRNVIIDNWAISGGQVDVLESAVRDQPDVGTYELAIVIEGVNDAHVLTREDWRVRYEAAIELLESKGPTVVLTTPPPRLEESGFDPRYDEVAAAVREVAAGGRPLLDLAVRWRADGASRARAYYVDPIHQSAAGQAVMATMAHDVVLAAIGR